jgi:hypothetical protein
MPYGETIVSSQRETVVKQELQVEGVSTEKRRS